MDEQFSDAMWKVLREDKDYFLRQQRFGEWVHLDKIDAAKRQLNTAVWLWLKDGDTASIHTLVGAAFGILADLYYHKHKKRPAPFSEEFVHEELRGYMKKLRNVMKSAEDFLKHARNDPDGRLTLTPLWTAHYIFCAIKAYTELNDGKCDQPLLSLFVFRFRILLPELFRDGSTPGSEECWSIERMNNFGRSNVEFFDRFGGKLRDGPPVPPTPPTPPPMTSGDTSFFHLP